MTRPAPHPQYRSADYSLKYQVMLETLKTTGQRCEPPFKFDAPLPTGVTDLNRPMLINTTSSKWKEMGVMATSHHIKRPKYQKTKRVTYQDNLKLQRLENAKNNGELAALSKLMERTTNRDFNGNSKVRRSKSEPMHLPPIDERTVTPGSRVQNQTPGTKGFKSPSYEVIKRGKKSSDGLGSNAGRRPDSTKTQTLPTLSKVSEEKSKYKDGAFIKGVQRHSGKYNINKTLGRPPPRHPRYSWEDNEKAKPVKDDDKKPEVNKPEGQKVPIRLRDMDLAFPMKNKMEKIRQWHENQFHKHLHQWKNSGSESEKRQEAMELLARYLEKENVNQKGTINKSKLSVTIKDGQKVYRPRTGKTIRAQSAMTKCSNSDKQKPPKPKQNSTAVVIDNTETQNENLKGSDINSKSELGGLCVEDEQTETVSNAFSRSVQPIKTLKGVSVEETVVYTDAEVYIEENNLLPPEKTQRISDWLESIDFSQDDLSPDSPENSEPQSESDDDTLSVFEFQPG